MEYQGVLVHELVQNYTSCLCPAYFRGGTLKKFCGIARECSRSKQDIIDGQTSILSLQTKYRWYYPWYNALQTATQFSHYPIIISLKQEILSTRMSCPYGMYASGSLVFEPYVFWCTVTQVGFYTTAGVYKDILTCASGTFPIPQVLCTIYLRKSNSFGKPWSHF